MKKTIFVEKVKGLGYVSIVLKDNLVEKITFKKLTGDTKPFNAKLKRWLKSYPNVPPIKFPYRLNLQGTPFQKAVWKAIAQIPYGETRTYQWVAEKIKNPSAVRAVGTACGVNPIPLVIPCHRVVSKNGPGGFSGGLRIKRALLTIEKPHNYGDSPRGYTSKYYAKCR